MSAAIANLLIVLVVFAAVGLFIAMPVAWLERVTVWELMGGFLRGLWTFCGELAATLMPPSRTRQPKPPISARVSCEREFLEGRIDVEEFERRVDAALRNGGGG